MKNEHQANQALTQNAKTCGPMHHFRAGGYCPFCKQAIERAEIIRRLGA